jgi:hypothetical protein
MKKPNWQLWSRLISIVNKKGLHLKLTKVKAHSKDAFNNQVDQLAKSAKEELEIQWEPLSKTIPITVPEWNRIPIDISTRAFLKDYNEREVLMQWISQNRIQQKWKEEIQNPEKFDWKGLWDYSKGEGSLTTSIKTAKSRTFKAKLIHNELPTMDTLTKRGALETSNSLCVFCQLQEETIDHLLTCKKVQEIKKNIWSQVQDKLIKTWIPQQINKKEDANITAIMELVNKWEVEKSDSAKKLINIVIGLWTKEDSREWTNLLRSMKISKIPARRILNKISDFWCKRIRQQIWNPRCEKVQECKKRFLEKGKGKASSSSNQDPSHPQNPKRKGKKTHYQDSLGFKPGESSTTKTSSDYIPGIAKVLWSKIKEGKKWLGI